MRNLLLTVFFMSFCYILNAQQQIDPRIRELYGDKANEMLGNNPELLNFWNDLLTNRIEIAELSASEDAVKFIKLSQIDLLNKYNPSIKRDVVFNPETFNPLKYNLEFTAKDTKKVYVVDNSNYIIIISPQTINH